MKIIGNILRHRYNIDVQFVSSKWTAQYIYSLFYYFLREKLWGG
jgi:hypothetical protein